jgi:hypothetical protein
MGLNNLKRRDVLAGLLGAGAMRIAAGAGPTTERLKSGSSTIEIEISEGALDLDRKAIVAWFRKAVDAVATYYGRFPVSAAHLEVQIVEGRPSVFNGVTYGRTPATTTRISVGEHVTQAGLDNDWVMTHEFVHLGFPSVPRRHHWIEEGLATYIEPLARLHLKQITEDVFWRDMIRDMPQGLPGEGDRGMDNTHTWGRTYWGGAIYWIEAEVAIRQKTSNKKGLQQALRGILETVGSIQEDAELAPVLAAGDKATGTTVLTDIYARVKDQPEPANLDEMWKSLGVSWRDKRVSYDDKAPLAATRRAIVTPLKS